MFVPAVETYSGTVVSTAMYLTSTDIPVVHAKESEEAERSAKTEKPVNVRLKNRPTVPLAVPLKPASQYEDSTRFYQTH